MAGSVVFYGEVGYDFYLVRRGLNGVEIECISMPMAGTLHRGLSDEIIIALPRSEDSQQRLPGKIEDVYENLRYRG